MKLAIVGSNGMLGHITLKYLSKNSNFTIYAFTRNRKICREGNIFYIPYSELFNFFMPYDYLINCAGILRTKEKNTEKIKEALEINTILPLKILESDIAKKIINITTDGVFSGKIGNYNEQSCHDACDVYGKTKSLGEINDERVLNLRCSIVGPENKTAKNLLAWFLSQNNDSTIKGYTNHLWNGITTLQFAKICENIILNDIKIHNVQHIVPQDAVNKYQLLELFKKYFNKNINILPTFAAETVNKTLSTMHKDINSYLWNGEILSIEAMISEIALWKHTPHF